MTKEQAKRWLPEITYWANGGNLWWYSTSTKKWYQYDDTDENDLAFYNIEKYSYVIEDEHFESRKAYALGESIEARPKNSPDKNWYLRDNPQWSVHSEYRPAKKEWFHNIPNEGIPCRVWKGDEWINEIAIITKYYTSSNYPFESFNGIAWKHAEPIKASECWMDKTNQK